MKYQSGPMKGNPAGRLGRKHSPSRTISGLSPSSLVGFLMFLVLGSIASDAFGQEYDLSDGNSSVAINASSPAGMFNYSVEGVNQVNNQWFYYRAGTMTSESSIDSIGALTAVQSSARNLSLTYTGAQYYARVVYTLTGTSIGSGQSGLNEGITFLNTSSSALTLSFFDYANFRLGGVAGGQALQFNLTSIPPPGHYNGFTQTAGPASLTAQLISTTQPSHIEAATFNQTLTSLNDNSATTLNDHAGPVSGDVTGTVEWDVNLPSGSSLTISELINLTNAPEPSSTFLIVFGLVAFAGLRRIARRDLPDSNPNH